MNMLTPAEIISAYADIGAKKSASTSKKLLPLAILAGFIVACAGAATTTAAHAVENISAAKIICGLLFPFALAIVMLMGAELFTGNCMIPVSIWEKKTSPASMLRNWGIVYFGNLTGSVLIAAACAYSGQFGYSNGQLAVYVVKTAVSKCSLSFFSAVVFGVLCNLLVCLGVLCSLSAKDTPGRILGAHIPVSFFVMCGFEHSVANMYYIPAGLFAMRNPAYSALVSASGIDTGMLTWAGFITRNLIPVTIGNILGGVMLAYIMWQGHINNK